MKRSTAHIFAALFAATAAGAVDRVPLEVTGYHAFVELLVEGTPLSFAFDSGAGGVGIDRGTADRLGLVATGTAAVTGAAGSTRVPLAAGLTLRLGQLRLDGVTAALVPLGHLAEAIGQPVDGIIGRDVLRGRLVVLDHERRRLEIHDRQGFPFDPWGEPCELESVAPIEVAGRIRLLDGQAVGGVFHIDTGAGGYLTLGAAFARAHRLAGRLGRTYPQKGRGLTGVRSGDLVGSVGGFGFCGRELPVAAGAAGPGLPTRVSGATAGVLAHPATAGLIGNGLLLRYDILFDLARRHIYLRPNSAWADPLRADASGLHLILRRGRTLVDAVVPSSPAAEALLVEGDELRAVDGRPVAGSSLADLRDKLTEPHRTLELLVVREGVARSVELRTRVLLAEPALERGDPPPRGPTAGRPEPARDILGRNPARDKEPRDDGK